MRAYSDVSRDVQRPHPVLLDAEYMRTDSRRLSGEVACARDDTKRNPQSVGQESRGVCGLYISLALQSEAQCARTTIVAMTP